MQRASETKLSKLYLIDPETGKQFHMLVGALNVSAGRGNGLYVVKIGGYLHESNAKRLLRVLGEPEKTSQSGSRDDGLESLMGETTGGQVY